MNIDIVHILTDFNHVKIFAGLYEGSRRKVYKEPLNKGEGTLSHPRPLIHTATYTVIGYTYTATHDLAKSETVEFDF